MTTLETLKAARKKIEDPSHWCQKNSAEDESGNIVPDTSPAAYRFCALGAVPWGRGMSGAFIALDDAAGGPIEEFNDNHTHAEVLAAFDAAIAKLERPV